jgi:VanZ family protein
MEVDADAPPRARGPFADAQRWLFRRAGRVLVIYWLAMFIGSHVSLKDPSTVFQIRDKVVHFAAFAGFAFLAATYQYSRKGSVAWVDLIAIWLLAAAYGVFDEVTQTAVGRTADPLDWLADISGAATGLAAFLVFRARAAAQGLFRGN